MLINKMNKKKLKEMEFKKEETKILIADFEANKKYIIESRKSGPEYGKRPEINIGKNENAAIDASGKKVYLTSNTKITTQNL